MDLEKINNQLIPELKKRVYICDDSNGEISIILDTDETFTIGKGYIDDFAVNKNEIVILTRDFKINVKDSGIRVHNELFVFSSEGF